MENVRGTSGSSRETRVSSTVELRELIARFTDEPSLRHEEFASVLEDALSNIRIISCSRVSLSELVFLMQQRRVPDLPEMTEATSPYSVVKSWMRGREEANPDDVPEPEVDPKGMRSTYPSPEPLVGNATAPLSESHKVQPRFSFVTSGTHIAPLPTRSLRELSQEIENTRSNSDAPGRVDGTRVQMNMDTDDVVPPAFNPRQPIIDRRAGSAQDSRNSGEDDMALPLRHSMQDSRMTWNSAEDRDTGGASREWIDSRQNYGSSRNDERLASSHPRSGSRNSFMPGDWRNQEARHQDEDFGNVRARAYQQLTKIYVKEKQFSGSCLQADTLSLEEVEKGYVTACENLNIEPNIADRLVEVVFKGPALKFYQKLSGRDKRDISTVFAAMRLRFVPTNVVRATEELWETYDWSRLMQEYPEVTDPSSLVQLLLEKGEAMQEKLPQEYSSDTHLRNWLVKCIRQTSFKRYMPSNRLSTSTEVAVAIGRALELHREETNCIRPVPEYIGRYPRRSSGSTPSVYYNSEEPDSEEKQEEARKGDAEIDAGDFKQVEEIYLADQRYRTKMKARDSSKGLMTFRGKADNRDPPQRQGEKPNQISKKSGLPLRCFRCNSKFHYIFSCPDASPLDKVYFSEALRNVEPDNSQTNPDHVLLASTVEADPSELNHTQILFAGSSDFLGFCIDTGCPQEVIGKSQLEAFAKAESYRRPLEASTRMFRFGKTTLPSLGKTRIYFYSTDGDRIHYETDVVDIEIPALIGLSLLFDSEADIDLKELLLVSPGWKAKLAHKNGHLFIEHPSDVLYSKNSLRNIHTRLGHPHPEATERFLSLSKPNSITASDKELLKEVAAECVVCEKFGPRPRRQRAVIPASVVFNYEVAIDVYYIHGYPAISVICTATSFVASSFIESRKSSVIWDTFMRIWVMAYVGAPSVVRLDVAGEHTSTEFRELAAGSGIELVFSPIESHWSLGAGERVHSSIKSIFQKVHTEAPSLSYITKLKAADFAFNSSPPRSGLPPALLVFGQVPRLPCADYEAAPSLTNDSRLGLMSIARAEAEVQHARRRYAEAMRRATPSECDELSTGDLCLVYREHGEFVHKQPGFTGPFIFLYRQGSNAFVLDGSEVKKFPATHVKPATASAKLRNDDQVANNIASATSSGASQSAESSVAANAHAVESDTALEISKSSEKQTESISEVPESAESAALRLEDLKQPIDGDDVLITEIITREHPRYDEEAVQAAITDEVQGLLDLGTFQLVRHQELPRDANIMGSRFVLCIKNYNSADEKVKARLVIQGCGDRDGDAIVTEAPTVSHFSIRMLVSISVLMGWNIWSKDARQAFLQAESGLSRDIYARLPKELRACFPKHVLKLLKPLYGLKESGSYWADTYLKAFAKSLEMKATFLDPCLLFRKSNGVLDGVSGVLVDDTLFTGTQSFAIDEAKMHEKFDMGARDMLTEDHSVKFAGVCIQRTKAYTAISQEEYILQIPEIEQSELSMRTIRQGRGKPAWVATWTRPDVAYRVGSLNQVTEDTISEDSIKALNKLRNYLLRSADISLKFPPLEQNSAYIAVYGDASLAGNVDLTSQMGGVVALRDKSDNCHLLHWFSKKCPRVTSSILAAEVIACVTAFDVAIAIREVLQEMLSRRVELYLFTDSYSLFSTITKYQSVREKRLLIDLAVLRQAYRKYDLDDVGFIRSAYNPADCLTKEVRECMLLTVLKTGKLTHPVDEYIQRNQDANRAEASVGNSVNLSIFYGSAW